MYQNESWGEGIRAAFEELISLSHLDVSSVLDSLWKPRFPTSLTVSLMITDNIHRLPRSEASNNEGRVSGERLRWSCLSFIIWPLSSKAAHYVFLRQSIRDRVCARCSAPPVEEIVSFDEEVTGFTHRLNHLQCSGVLHQFSKYLFFPKAALQKKK